MSEIVVILKDAERTYKQKFLIYEPYKADENDPIILACIDAAMKNFNGQPENIQVKINLEIQ